MIRGLGSGLLMESIGIAVRNFTHADSVVVEY